MLKQKQEQEQQQEAQMAALQEQQLLQQQLLFEQQQEAEAAAAAAAAAASAPAIAMTPVFDRPLPDSTELDDIIGHFKDPLWKHGIAAAAGKAPSAPFLTLKSADSAIAEKIKQINTSFFSQPKIPEALKQIIRYPRNSTQVQIAAEVNKSLIQLYTQILYLMEQIIMYMNQRGVLNDNKVLGMDPHMYHIWLQYLSDLESLRIIFMHANENKIININSFHSLETLLKESMEKIKKFKRYIHENQKKIYEAQVKIAERDAKYDDIDSQFSSVSDDFNISRAQYEVGLNRLRNAFSTPIALKATQDDLMTDLKDPNYVSPEQFSAQGQSLFPAQAINGSWQTPGPSWVGTPDASYAAYAPRAEGPYRAQAADSRRFSEGAR